MRNTPQPGEIWAHYHNRIECEIIAIAIDASTDDCYVIYRVKGKDYVRSLDNFMSNAIDRWGNPIYRFERVEESEPTSEADNDWDIWEQNYYDLIS